MFPTVRDALATASPKSVTEGNPIVQEGNPIVQVGRLIVPEAQKVEEIDKAEINRLGRIVVLSLTGFLVTGWFLSRSFVMTFFLLGGIAEVVFQMALQRGMVAPRLQFRRVLLYTGELTVGLILLMYVLLRAVNLMH